MTKLRTNFRKIKQSAILTGSPNGEAIDYAACHLTTLSDEDRDKEKKREGRKEELFNIPNDRIL